MGSCFSINKQSAEPQQITKYRHPKKKSIRPSTNKHK